MTTQAQLVKDADDMRGLWEETRQAFSRSRRNIQTVRQWLAQDVPPEVPEDFQAEVDIRLQLPIAVTTSAHTIQMLARKRPVFHRQPLGTGLAPRRRSTKVEQWVNALPTQLEDQGGPLWRPWIEGLFSHGEAALVQYPYMAHWERFPEFADDTGEIKAGFARDGKDRAADDDYYVDSKTRKFKANGKTSAAAYDSFLADWKASRLPLVARCISADQCLPILGPNFRLDGLLIQSEYSEYSLKRKGYEWIGGDRQIGPGQTPDSPNKLNNNRSLVELLTPGKIQYFVGTKADWAGPNNLSNKATTRSTTESGAGWLIREMYDTRLNGKPAEIDLEEAYGFGDLPAYYGYGAHWAIESDPDRRALPFLFAFTSSLHFLNSVVNAKGVQMWNRAFGQDYVEVDPAIAENHFSLIADESGAPRKIPRKPNIAQYVGGHVVRGYDTTASREVDEMVSLLLGTVKEEAPNVAAFGGSGATSGHDRSLIRSFLEMAYNDVLDGGLGGWRWLGKSGLEWGSRIAKQTGTSIPLHVQVEDN